MVHHYILISGTCFNRCGHLSNSIVSVSIRQSMDLAFFWRDSEIESKELMQIESLPNDAVRACVCVDRLVHMTALLTRPSTPRVPTTFGHCSSSPTHGARAGSLMHPEGWCKREVMPTDCPR